MSDKEIFREILLILAAACLGFSVCVATKPDECRHLKWSGKGAMGIGGILFLWAVVDWLCDRPYRVREHRSSWLAANGSLFGRSAGPYQRITHNGS
jgi:hypothetical protein